MYTPSFSMFNVNHYPLIFGQPLIDRVYTDATSLRFLGDTERTLRNEDSGASLYDVFLLFFNRCNKVQRFSAFVEATCQSSL